ncbi:uncharacterized protein N7503_003870 [Penicillium pulvis]|uniref:uncharacterized protein n=1 Tax=Penicillium pulvis TaxID=1562058 RepID=UPI002547CE40|nr:uncharacterized protein N7503_003870 [Penicillium pulvis]KAJ5806268.1 hypothetical protein N7503_003870 [Penicillium pulvis]
MGLRTLLKALRPSDGKETPTSLSPLPSSSPSPSKVGTDKNNSVAAATSSHTLQPGSCNSDLNITSDDSLPRDLWDEAYAILSVEDPELIGKYENILLTQMKGKGDSSQNHLAPVGSYKREEQLRQIAKSKVEEIDLAQWQVKIGNHSVDVSGQFNKVVKIVVAAKDFVSSAVSAEPHAALAWAGVCLFLPLLLSPSEQKSAAHDGLEAVPFCVHRLRVMERLIRPGKSGLTQSSYLSDSLELVKDFERTVVDLYKTILEFQIRLVRQHSNNWAKQYGRDIFKADDWTSLTSQVKTLEAKCTEIAQDLSRERIERALQVSEHNMQCGLQEVQKELRRTKHGIEQQAMMQFAWRQTDKERKCVQMFRQSNPYENQKNRTPKRVFETGKWFLENDKFLDWREKEGPDLLWMSAKPGSGKSVLVKTMIDEGLVTLSHQKLSAVCYFFFKDISPYQRSALSAMSAILHQLFSAFPSLVKHALSPYDLNGRELLNLFDEMFDILCQAATDPSVGQIVCILDALDECNDDDQLVLIESIINFYHTSKNDSRFDDRPKLKFLLTSRPYSHIHSQFDDLITEAPTIHLSGDHESENIKDEIDLVIDVKVPKLAAERGFDEEATKYLLKELHTVDNRTYLWLSLIMEEIRLSERPANKRELQKIISSLPRSLIDAYDAILRRCRHPDLARQLLHIILAAREPLAVDDMKIATALASDFKYRSYEEIGTERLDAFEMRIKNVCGLLVTIDNGSVFLIHQTAKEFLITDDYTSHRSDTWKHSFSPLDSETLLAKICISLLSFTHFLKAPLTIDDSDDEPHKKVSEYTKDNPFLEYAAMNWVEHCQEAMLGEDPEWVSSMLFLCSVERPAFRTWYAIYQISGKNHLPWKMTSLNIAAEFGFPYVLASLLESGEDPNEPDGHGATPLARSVQKSTVAVDLLLNANADINAYGWEEPWYEDVDNTGSDIEVKPFSGTPLVMAVFSDDAEMVKYLIEHGAVINFPPHSSLTPLFIACLQYPWDEKPKAKEILHLLLRSGADVCFEMINEDWPIEMTVLHFAAMNNDLSVLQVLLGSKTADVNFQLRESPSHVRMEDLDTTEYQSIIDEPECSSDKIKSLQAGPSSASGRDIDGSRGAEDSKGGGDIDDNTSIPDNQDSDDDSGSGFNNDTHQSDSSESSDSPQNYVYMIGATPLHLAARGGLVKNVELLLKYGADPHVKNANGYTAMDFALELTRIEDIDDEEDFSSIKAEIIELLEQNDHIPSDGEESFLGTTSLNG